MDYMIATLVVCLVVVNVCLSYSVFCLWQRVRLLSEIADGSAHLTPHASVREALRRLRRESYITEILELGGIDPLAMPPSRLESSENPGLDEEMRALRDDIRDHEIDPGDDAQKFA